MADKKKHDPKVKIPMKLIVTPQHSKSERRLKKENDRYMKNDAGKKKSTAARVYHQKLMIIKRRRLNKLKGNRK